MPASAARIGFITQEFRKVSSITSSVRTRYGAQARETADPMEAFFDSESDAQAFADARQALLSADRRRFRATVSGVSEALALDFLSGVPLARYVDTERNADRPMLVSEMTIDLGRNNAVFTVWG